MTITVTKVPVNIYYLALADQIISGSDVNEIKKVISYKQGKNYSDILVAKREFTRISSTENRINFLASKLEAIVEVNYKQFDSEFGKPQEGDYKFLRRNGSY